MKGASGMPDGTVNNDIEIRIEDCIDMHRFKMQGAVLHNGEVKGFMQEASFPFQSCQEYTGKRAFT